MTILPSPPTPALVIGSDGLLGRSVSTLLRNLGVRVSSTSRRPETSQEYRIDLEDPASGRWSPTETFATVFLCVGPHSMRECRLNPSEARRIYQDNLLELCSRLKDSTIVFISSNQVFDGLAPLREAMSLRQPLTEYGRIKAQVEDALLACGRARVIRLGKVLHDSSPLLCGWRSNLALGKPIEAFADMTLAPVPLPLASRAIVAAATASDPILQLSGPEDVSYAEFARLVARHLGYPGSSVRESSAAHAGIPPEERPPHTTLDSSRLEDLLGERVPPLAGVLQQLSIAPPANQPSPGGRALLHPPHLSRRSDRHVCDS